MMREIDGPDSPDFHLRGALLEITGAVGILRSCALDGSDLAGKIDRLALVVYEADQGHPCNRWECHSALHGIRVAMDDVAGAGRPSQLESEASDPDQFWYRMYVVSYWLGVAEHKVVAISDIRREWA